MQVVFAARNNRKKLPNKEKLLFYARLEATSDGRSIDGGTEKLQVQVHASVFFLRS
jgi:hypothetical protein